MRPVAREACMFWGKKPEKSAAPAAPNDAPPAPQQATPPPAKHVTPEPNKAAREAKLFISYRRSSALIVDHIHEKLTGRLGRVPIFLDRNDIDPGAGFPDRIRHAVESASIVLVIIGRDWISAQDERTYRRRLDMPSDWVRQEIELALSKSDTVIPVLIEDAPMPSPDQLPDSIVALAQKNAVTLSRDHFNDDVNKLTDFVLKKLGAERASAILQEERKFPTPASVKPVQLTAEQIAQVVASLPQWKVLESPLHDDARFGSDYRRIELMREFRFESFLDAIAFMRSAADKIEVLGHHPRWENVFRTVTVWLSTWDIGHRPSDRDWKCASMLEDLYKQYLAPRA
jgi:pterin-4a-carbinolamine dehydratase